MTPFKLYTSFNREVRNFKEGTSINTAEITYWLNKALEEFVDKKYTDFEGAEDVIQDLKNLLYAGNISTTYAGSSVPPSYVGTLASDVRYIVQENVVINAGGTIINSKITPSSLDVINIKIKDPFSQHILHQGNAEPLRYFVEKQVLLVASEDYTITNYKYRYIKNPTLFKIQDALSTSTLQELPHKAYKEILAAAIRMFLENNSNARYNTYNNEVNKTEL
jgi:hypothetical protein